MDSNIPHRFRESSFRSYESSILSIVNNYPRPTFFRSTVSTETFTCRIRDAITAFLQSTWDSAIPRERLKEIRPKITFSYDPSGQIRVGPKDKRLEISVQPSSKSEQVVRTTNVEVLKAFALLISESQFDKEIRAVDAVTLFPDLDKQLSEFSNIEVFKQQNDWIIL